MHELVERAAAARARSSIEATEDGSAFETMEAHLARMLDSMPHQVLCLRSDGTLGYLNRQLVEYTGLSAQRLQSGLWDALHPDDVDEALRVWREAFAGRRAFEMDVRIRGRDGTYRRFRWHGAPIGARYDGSALEYFCTQTDIEEHCRSFEALRAAQAEVARMARAAMLSGLSVALAHELNQPLAAIVANADASLRWQRRSRPNRKEIALAAKRIRRDALRASALVGRFHRFLQKAEPVPAAVNFEEAAREAFEMLEFEFKRHHVMARLAVSRPLPEIVGIRVELQQVMLNLLMNSIDALAGLPKEQERRLSLRCRCESTGEKGFVVASVQDSGSGFDEMHESDLFNAFFTTKRGGLGMGLAISRMIVATHGGEIGARNTPSGPIFEFRIPVQPGGR